MEKQTFISLRNKIAYENFPNFYGSLDDLTPNQKIQLTNLLKDYIRKNPSEFNENQKLVGNSKNVESLESYEVSEMLADFGSEFVNQAQEINPLSTVNRTKFFVGLFILAAIGIGFYSYSKGKQ